MTFSYLSRGTDTEVSGLLNIAAGIGTGYIFSASQGSLHFICQPLYTTVTHSHFVKFPFQKTGLNFVCGRKDSSLSHGCRRQKILKWPHTNSDELLGLYGLKCVLS